MRESRWVGGWGEEREEKGRGRGRKGGEGRRREGSCFFSFAYQIQDIYKTKIWSKERNLGEDLAMIHMH